MPGKSAKIREALKAGTIIDYSKSGRPSKEHLATIPVNINELIFPGTQDEPELIAKYLAWLPPHIKKITFPLHYPALAPLCFPFGCKRNTRVDSRALIERALPFTLDQAVLGDNIRVMGTQAPAFPASYQAAFMEGYSSQLNSDMDPVVRGMRELLCHYLGLGERSRTEGVARTWLRCFRREHEKEVRDVIKRIDRRELLTPLELLAALKAIEPENPRGGLRMRIHFLSNFLSFGCVPQASSSMRVSD